MFFIEVCVPTACHYLSRDGTPIADLVYTRLIHRDLSGRGKRVP